jgi:hypothetical protein
MAMLRQLSGRGRVVTTVDLKLDLVERCFLVIEYSSMQVAKGDNWVYDASHLGVQKGNAG